MAAFAERRDLEYAAAAAAEAVLLHRPPDGADPAVSVISAPTR